MFVLRFGSRLLSKKILRDACNFRNTNPQIGSIQALQKFLYFEQYRKMSSSLSSEFKNATEKLKSLKDDPGNEIKLQLYALFKQANEGPCPTGKSPSAFDFVGKAKWSAWKGLGEMSQDEAKTKYIALVNELCNKDAENEPVFVNEQQQYEGITYTVGKNFTEIMFARPSKKNAITKQMYTDIVLALNEARKNDTAVTIITGQGDYYSSGNDLSNFASVQGDLSTAAKNASQMLKEFVAAFIDFDKILVAAVNGPAVGIPVTLLGLCDIVYASEKATFYTPFSLLGQSPEGCSTYTFPKIMGYSKANEMLLFNKKMTAREAKEVGLVSKIFPHDSFLQDIKNELSFLSSASKQSMIHSKALARNIDRKILHQVNEDECNRLIERWQSQDCMEAIMKFFQNKNKL